MNEQNTQRYYNQKSMVVAVTTVGTAAYLMGLSRGSKKAYVEGLKDGLKQGILEGRLEGYVNAMQDVASIMRNLTE